MGESKQELTSNMRILSRLQLDRYRDSSQENGVQTLSERTNIAFLAILLIAPLSVLFSRWVIRLMPVGDVVGLLTSFGEDRIQSELRRIQVETSDYLYFAIVAFSFLLVFFASSSRSLIHLCLSRSLLAAPLRWVRKNSYLIAVFLISIHIGSLHRWRIGAFGNRFLDGFGAGPTFLAIVILISATRAETHLNLRHQLRNSRSGNWVLSALAVLILLPQTLTFGRQIGSNREYVIAFNEYAAASSNLRPLRDFSPTYSSRHTVKATCFPLQIYRPRVVFASKKFLPEQFKEPDSTAVPCPGLQRDHTFRSELLIRYYFKP